MVLSLVLAVSAHAAPGDLDTSFGAPNGFVLTGQLGQNLGGGRVLVDPSGRIVVMGGVNGAQAFVVLRYLPTGALDHDFNGSGMNSQSLNGVTETSGIAMLREPAGQLLLGGYAGSSSDRQFMLARFTDAGALDSTFGPAGNPPGTVKTDVPASSDERITGIGLLSSGKIAVVGSAQVAGFEYMRYTDTGGVDLAPTLVSFTGVTGYSPRSMIVAPGDKVLVGGFATVGTTQEFFVARLLSDGAPDATFGTGGIATFNIGDLGGSDSANAIALQPDGSVVMAGTADVNLMPHVAVARVTPSGNLDPSFGFQGVTELFPGSTKSEGTAVALQPNGKVLVSGAANVIGEGSGDFTLMRLNSNGAPDPTFGSGGAAVHSLVPGGDIAQGVALQPDGNVVLAGTAFGTAADVAVARFVGGEVAVKGPPPPPGDTTKPKISKLKLLTKRVRATLKVRVHMSEASKVTIKVVLRKRKLAAKTVRFTKAQTKTIKIKLRHRAFARLAKLHRPAIKLTVTATDLAGNKAKRRTLSARLRT